MDTSREYINMCEKAEEIQELALWLDGDFYQRADMKIKCFHKYYPPKGAIWLPRQDQLQDMVSGGDLYPLVYNFWMFFNNDPGLKSMEQLWLAFVMKEKYNKIWLGEAWRPYNGS